MGNLSLRPAPWLDSASPVFRVAKVKRWVPWSQAGRRFDACADDAGGPLEDNRRFRVRWKLIAGEVDALVVLTGIGTRVLIEALLTRWDREQVLRVVGNLHQARSGKPVAALRKFGLKADYVAALPNAEELLAEVDTHGLAIAAIIQEYGAINERLVAGLREGAQVSSVRCMFGSCRMTRLRSTPSTQ